MSLFFEKSTPVKRTTRSTGVFTPKKNSDNKTVDDYFLELEEKIPALPTLAYKKKEVKKTIFGMKAKIKAMAKQETKKVYKVKSLKKRFEDWDIPFQPEMVDRMDDPKWLLTRKMNEWRYLISPTTYGMNIQEAIHRVRVSKTLINSSKGDDMPELIPATDSLLVTEDSSAWSPFISNPELKFQTEMFGGLMPNMPTVNLGLNEETRSYVDNTVKGVMEHTNKKTSEVTDFMTSMINKLLEMAKGLSADVGEKLKNVTIHHDFFSRLPDFGGQFAEWKQYLSNLRHHPPVNFMLTALGYYLFFLFLIKVVKVTPEQYAVIYVAVTVMNFTGLDDYLLSKLKLSITYLMDMVKPEPINDDFDFRTQADDKGGVSGLLTLLLGVIVGDNITGNATVRDKVAKICGTFKAQKDALSTTVEFIFSALSQVLNFIGSVTDITGLKNLGIKFPRLVDIAEEMTTLANSLSRGEIQHNALIANTVRDRIKELNQILAEIGLDKSVENQRRECLRLIVIATNIEKACGSAGTVTAGSRCEPVGVLFVGGPGTGKSTLIEYMAQEIVASTLLPGPRLDAFNASPTEELVAVNSETSEHWDFYNGQRCVFLDDILQTKDSEVGGNAMIPMIIRMCNSMPMMLPCAEIHRKSGVYFTSDFVLATDNNLSCRPFVKSINSLPALVRRFDLQYAVVVKDEHVDVPDGLRVEDISVMNRRRKVPIMAAMTEEFANEYMFMPIDWGTGKQVGALREYREVIQEIVELSYHKKKCADKFRGIVRSARLKGFERAAQIQKHNLLEEIKNPDQAMRRPVKRLSEILAKEKVEKVEQSPSEFKCQMLMGMNPWAYFGIPNTASMEEITAAFDVKAAIEKENPEFGGLSRELVHCFLLCTVPELKEEYLLCEEIDNADTSLYTMMYLQNKIVDFLKRKKLEPLCEEVIDELTFHKAITQDCLINPYRRNYASPVMEQAFCEKYGVSPKDFRLFQAMKVCRKDMPLYDMYDKYLRWAYKRTLSLYDQAKKGLDKILTSLIDICTNRKLWIALGAVAGVAYTGYTYFCKGHGFFVEESISFKDKKRDLKPEKIVRTARHVVRPKAIAPKELGTEMYFQGENVDNVVGVVSENIFDFWLDDDTQVRGEFLFTHKKFAIGLCHYIDNITRMGIKTVTIKRRSTPEDKPHTFVCGVDLEYLGLDNETNEDVLYFRFKKLPFDVPSILKHFPLSTDEKIVEFLSSPHWGTLVTPSDKENVVWSPKPGYTTPYNGRYGENLYDSKLSFFYRINTRPGFCCCPWIVSDSRAGKSFIGGVHVAGDGKGYGMAIVVFRDNIEYVCSKFDEIDELPTEVIPTVSKFATQMHIPKSNIIKTDASQDSWIPDHFKIIGAVPTTAQSSFTKLRKSVLFEGWSKNDKVPAKMRPFLEEGIERNPFLESRLPYNKYEDNLDISLIQHCADNFARQHKSIGDHDHPWTARLYDIRETVEGIPGIFNGTPRGTGAGYPWNKLGGNKMPGKTGYFGTGDTYEYESPLCKLLLAEVDGQIDLLEKHGVCPEYLYSQFLKDELRTPGKVARVVAGAPLDSVLIYRRYFGDYSRWAMDNKIFNSMTLGINPYSDWDSLARYLSYIGDNIIDGDFSKYDSKISMRMAIHFALRVIEIWYTASPSYRSCDSVARLLLVIDFINSKQICPTIDVSYVVQYVNSVPSGGFLTALFDSLINIGYFMYAKSLLKLEEQGLTLEDDYFEVLSTDFYLTDRFVANGDDNIISVGEKHKELITQKSYSRVMASMGLVYTDSAKTGVIVETHRSLAEVTFLKRSFKKLPGYGNAYFAALDLDTILQMLYWIEKGKESTLSDTCDVVAMELSAHGYDTFSEWCKKIVPVLRVKRINFKLFPLLLDEDSIYRSWVKSLSAFKGRDVNYA